MPVCSLGSQQGEAEDSGLLFMQATGMVDFNSIVLPCLLGLRLWVVIPSSPSLLPETGDRQIISFCSNDSEHLSPVDFVLFYCFRKVMEGNGRLLHLA